MQFRSIKAASCFALSATILISSNVASASRFMIDTAAARYAKATCNEAYGTWATLGYSSYWECFEDQVAIYEASCIRDETGACIS